MELAQARMNLDMARLGAGERVSDEERAYLLLPRPALSGCIALGIVRDTRGVKMSDAQRLSHFPRSPYCGISWVLEGEVFELEPRHERGLSARLNRLPDLSVSGQRLHPITMWSPGPAHGVTIAFYPDAWQALTGVDTDMIRGRNLPPDGILAPEIARLVREAAAQSDVEAGFRLFEDGLLPLWRDRRPRDRITPFWFRDWTNAVAVRAATSGAGRSLRQVQRRIKAWSGLSRRDLAQQARVEELFAHSLVQGELDLAGLAQEFGYADQAHMGRQVRRITGAPPAKIMDLIETQESYWIYRLIGARFQAAK